MKTMADLVVGRSEGVSYPNNNLIYNQFKQLKPMLKESNTHFIELMVKEIKEAKNDDELKNILHQVYITTQYDSQVRAEFDNYYILKG